MNPPEKTEQTTVTDLPSDGSKEVGIFISVLMLAIWLIVLPFLTYSYPVGRPLAIMLPAPTHSPASPASCMQPFAFLFMGPSGVAKTVSKDTACNLFSFCQF